MSRMETGDGGFYSRGRGSRGRGSYRGRGGQYHNNNYGSGGGNFYGTGVDNNNRNNSGFNSYGNRGRGRGRGGRNTSWGSRGRGGGAPSGGKPGAAKELTQLVGHRQTVAGLAVLTEQEQLLSASHDGSVRIWDCATGKCAHELPVGGQAQCMLVEGDYLFVGVGVSVKYWNMSTNTQAELTGHTDTVNALAVHAESGMLFSASKDSSIRAWKFDAQSNAFQFAGQCLGHIGSVQCLEILGNLLCSGSADNTIKVWGLVGDIAGTCIQTLEGHSHMVTGLVSWQDHLISCDFNGFLKVWGTQGQSMQCMHSHPEEGHMPKKMSGCLAMTGIADNAQNPVLLVAYLDKSIKLWELPTFKYRGALYQQAMIRSLVAGPGMFFTGDENGLIKVWNCTD
mmetsp:Transcript_5368/g.19618  ORF Transcript_5368/g.19618 Transcript_5368/m.19618 type:complete len:395 (+) Transcript_5368:195-1379(+)